MKVLTILTITLSTLVALSSQGTPLQQKNAKEALKLQKKFDKLTKNSPCKVDDVCCIDGKFAKCHNVLKNGKIVPEFSIQPCGVGTQCFVLPLLLKPGTSVTCTTQEDHDRRIKDALGEEPVKKGPKKSKKPAEKEPAEEEPTEEPAEEPAEEPVEKPEEKPEEAEPTDKAEIRRLNAEEALKLTEEFKTFTADQECKVDEIACIGDAFAKCHNVMKEGGLIAPEFSIQPCAPGLKCCVLPLVNKRGISITCSTEADRLARIDQAFKNK